MAPLCLFDKPIGPTTRVDLSIYACSVKDDYPRIVAKEIMVVLAAKWQSLSEEDKELWNVKGKQAREAFKKASAEGSR